MHVLGENMKRHIKRIKLGTFFHLNYNFHFLILLPLCKKVSLRFLNLFISPGSNGDMFYGKENQSSNHRAAKPHGGQGFYILSIRVLKRYLVYNTCARTIFLQYLHRTIKHSRKARAFHKRL